MCIRDRIQGASPNTRGGKELTYIRQVAQQTTQYGAAIKSAAAKVTKQFSGYPTANSLADQLKIVARLIAGGLKTRIYMVSLGGFDTHALQVIANATDTGAHARLLQRVSEGIKALGLAMDALARARGTPRRKLQLLA